MTHILIKIVKKYAMYTQMQINQSQHAFLTQYTFKNIYIYMFFVFVFFYNIFIYCLQV